MSDKEKQKQEGKDKIDKSKEDKAQELSDDDLDQVAGGKKIKTDGF